MRQKLTEELKENIIEYYKSKPMSLGDVAKKFHICKITVRKVLGDTPLYPKNKVYNPELDEDFFENIDTEAKAYFLGLIIADGNVYNPQEHSHKKNHFKNKWVSITLQDGDSYILDKFKECIGANTKISSDGRGSSYIAIRSTKLADDLSKWGVVERKSFITRFPFNIPKEYYRHVIRGIIDGDGHIDAYFHYTENDNRNRFNHKISCCGTYRLMSEMVNIICNNIYIENRPSVYTYKSRELSEFKVSNINDMFNFGEWLYNNATIYMVRKYENYIKFKQHYSL